jgi:opacity protein-like surface antigen
MGGSELFTTEIDMRKLLFLMAAVSVCGMAQAADNGFYLGAGVTQAKIDDIGDDFDTGDLDDFEIDSTAWKIIAGFRPIKLFAVEANYNDLGDEGRTVGGVRFDADASAFTAYAIGFLPIPVVDVYAKAGLARWETEASIDGLFDLDDSGTEFAYGAGVQVNLGSLGARLEYEQFDVENTDGVELLTLGVTWTFL